MTGTYASLISYIAPAHAVTHVPMICGSVVEISPTPCVSVSVCNKKPKYIVFHPHFHIESTFQVEIGCMNTME